MWGIWVVFVALCLAGNVGVSGKDTMGRLHWCNTLCMCQDSTQVEVKCFERSDIYDLLGINKIRVIKLERANWDFENKVLWCNDTCLCHQNKDHKVFKCVEEDILHQFISDEIGDMYFYEDEEEEEEAATHQMEHRKRSERRKNRNRNRKLKKTVKNKQQVTEIPTTPIPEVIEEVTSPEQEVDFVTMEEILQTPTTERTTTEMPSTSKTTSIFLPTEAEPEPEPDSEPESEPEAEPEPEPEAEPEPEPEAEPEPEPEIELEEEGGGGSFEEEDAEILPKQEAVAASPAVTAMQPPTRRQPFPPTVTSHAATREAETPAPKVSAVLEVPIQRKTVASEVSQDLDELGSAVMQIKSDVVLNQRILLVTVAVAGIAMLGVLMLAVHGCFASKRQAAADAERRKKECPKDDNHVTKVNLEEAW